MHTVGAVCTESCPIQKVEMNHRLPTVPWAFTARLARRHGAADAAVGIDEELRGSLTPPKNSINRTAASLKLGRYFSAIGS